ncbi:MAG: hypothetical protein KGL39_37450 [Patescibacteria group bacterium]|nr:hypothetical protein [Patescibacteria group bacterium]
MRGRFEYQIVKGAVIYGYPYKSLPKAREGLHKLRLPGAEIERIKLLTNSAKRYYRWRAGDWSLDFNSEPTAADLYYWGSAPEVFKCPRGYKPCRQIGCDCRRKR